MYFDGHKRDNVVAYREAFVHRWAEYETCFQFWDDNGNPLPCHSNSVLLILVTHDESVFFQNNERKTSWGHNNSAPAPKPKGEGQSLMVSDFLTMEWGCLCDGDRCVVPFFLVAHSHWIISMQRGTHCVQAREESWWLFQCEGAHQSSQSCNQHFRGQDNISKM